MLVLVLKLSALFSYILFYLESSDLMVGVKLSYLEFVLHHCHCAQQSILNKIFFVATLLHKAIMIWF